MTNEEIDKLVWLIFTGRNTYKDIHEKFPNIDNYRLLNMSYNAKSGRNDIGDLRKYILMDRQLTIIEYDKGYCFQDHDTFHLSDLGKDRAYILRKEHDVKALTQTTITWAKWAVYLSAISFIYQLATSTIGTHVLEEVLDLLQSVLSLMR